MPRAGPGGLALLFLAMTPPLPADEPARGGTSTFRDCDVCPEMVVVPAGSFVMGSPSAPAGLQGAAAAEAEPVVIELPGAFALGRFEVTRGEFARFIADSGYEPDTGCLVWDAALGRFSDDPRRGWQEPGSDEGSDRLPVSCVSFADAQAFVQWVAQKSGERYRLPSEAEWEYAARAGSSGLRPWGDDPEPGCDYANTYDLVADDALRLGWPNAGCRDGSVGLAPVGQYAANRFGLHDMIGNVREWVQDCATGSYSGRPRDGRAWEWLGGCESRVQRGGSWLTPPLEARSASRTAVPAVERTGDAGFRVARGVSAREADDR